MPSELSDHDIAAIQDLHARWIRAELTRDLSQVIEFCTDDVSWIPPNATPLVGKQAIAQYLSDSTVELKEIKVGDVLVRGSGSVAYLTSNYHTRFAPAGSSEVQEVTGTHLWILRRTENGSWRVAIVTWSVCAPRHG